MEEFEDSIGGILPSPAAAGRLTELAKVVASLVA